MRFTLRGKELNLTPEDIEARLQGVDPEGSSQYHIAAHGKSYPVKQVLALITGMPNIAFTTADAYRILTKLGYDIEIEG
jgi:hypothetical protein